MARKSYRHWTPRYIFDRAQELLYHRLYPDRPWLTKAANSMLPSLLKPTDTGIELGSGRSTVWFARYVHFLTSVESNVTWYEKVRRDLGRKGIENVRYILSTGGESGVDAKESYLAAIREAPDASFDFALVDGIFRDACAKALPRKIRPGGVLIVDNCNWFLPSRSSAPGSRTYAQGPASPDWAEFLQVVAGWRSIWTSSGVTDTALFFKPCPV